MTDLVPGSISDELQRPSSTNTVTDAPSIGTSKETEVIKSTNKGKRVKLKQQSGRNFPAKKQKEWNIEYVGSERFSIAAISGETLPSTSGKGKQKAAKSGVVSISKPKVRKSKKNTDISELSNITFGTGQTMQWL